MRDPRPTFAALGLLVLAAAGCSTSSGEPGNHSTAAATRTSSPSVDADPSAVRCPDRSPRYRLATVSTRRAVIMLATLRFSPGSSIDEDVVLDGGSDPDVRAVGATIDGSSAPRVAAELQQQAAKVTIQPVGSTLADEPRQRSVKITNPDDANRSWIPFRWTALVRAAVEESSCAGTPTWSAVGTYTAYSPLVDGLTACGGLGARDRADALAKAARQRAGC